MLSLTHIVRTSRLAVPALLLGAATTLPAQIESSDRPDFLMAKPVATTITGDHSTTEIGLKFAHGSGVKIRDGRFAASAPSDELTRIGEHLAGLQVKVSPLFQQDRKWLVQWVATGEARSGKTLHDLTLFYRLEFAKGTDVGVLCDKLNSFEIVEIAWPFGRVEDPSARPSTAKPAAVAATPNFQGQQDYRKRAPLGVDADYGNSFSGGLGIGTMIADVETGWTHDHEDIINKAHNKFVGLMGAPYPWDHGTAVLGELIGEANGFGVLGICADASIVLSSHLGNASNNPTAMAAGAQALSPGDTLVIEVQCYNGPPAPHPCEYDPAVFAVVQSATANGIHVFAAAGNGNRDLDSSAYGGAFTRSVRDSGSVIVGASNGSSLNKASFSNYGSRVDVHGWGENVVTTGYGNLQSGPPTEEYTSSFSGTSSATPIATGAGVILNSIHREAFGTDMTPLVLRDLLTRTGTPQGTGGQIGPRPNVRAAIRDLGIPELAIEGRFVPGGQLVVSSIGEAGDSYFGFLTVNGQRAAPLYVPPFGYFFLADPVVVFATGAIGPNGVSNDVIPIPSSPLMSGVAVRIQELQIFNNKPGTGSLSNHSEAVIR